MHVNNHSVKCVVYQRRGHCDILVTPNLHYKKLFSCISVLLIARAKLNKSEIQFYLLRDVPHTKSISLQANCFISDQFSTNLV